MRLLVVPFVLAVAASVGAEQAAAHACSYGERPEDACLAPVVGPPGTEVTLMVQGSARTGTEICVVWNDRRMTGILAGVIPAVFSRETCPAPLPAENAEPARVCLADLSRGGRNACDLREPEDPEILLARFTVSEEDRVRRPHPLFFEKAVRFRVPDVEPGLYLVSWLDCPPGDCAHLVFSAFRVKATSASAPDEALSEASLSGAAEGSQARWWPFAVGGAGAAALLSLALLFVKRVRSRTG